MEEIAKEGGKEARKPVRKILEGEVISTKMQKTAVVVVKTRVPHPIYKKYFVRKKRFKVHDPQQRCGKGDLVRIVECRPISKEKRWALHSIIEKAGEEPKAEV